MFHILSFSLCYIESNSLWQQLLLYSDRSVANWLQDLDFCTFWYPGWSRIGKCEELHAMGDRARTTCILAQSRKVFQRPWLQTRYCRLILWGNQHDINSLCQALQTLQTSVDMICSLKSQNCKNTKVLLKMLLSRWECTSLQWNETPD